ncbi:MAG: FAD-binding protein [Nocardiaceae bacterium]|nr:FAD-binding protein [Nocardiaceae bacterium]
MTWQNWGRTESSSPSSVLTPVSEDGVAAAIETARETGTTVKAVGAGHSFSGIAVPGETMLDLTNMRGLLRIDGLDATFRAGTHLYEIPAWLAPHGLAMANLGDIDRQTLAGATSTGTHGTGVTFGGISTQITRLRLVTGTCEEREVTDPTELQAAALGLGALGIVTEITVRCVPAFSIEASEQPAKVGDVLARLPEEIETNDHFEFYWFPHTEAALTKRNKRLSGLVEPSGPSALRRYVDDELLSNKLFGGLCRLSARFPKAVPTINKISGNALSGRTIVDASAAVFASERKVRFREMEYAVPLEKLGEAFEGVRKVIADKGYRVSFPIEVRSAAADDLMLSTASGRTSGYVAVHRYFRDEPDDYFRDVEEVMVNLGGRPHWGKMHTRDAEYLRGVYPRFDEFCAVRDRLDPDRVFRNSYLDRVLGDGQ